MHHPPTGFIWLVDKRAIRRWWSWRSRSTSGHMILFKRLPGTLQQEFHTSTQENKIKDDKCTDQSLIGFRQTWHLISSCQEFQENDLHFFSTICSSQAGSPGTLRRCLPLQWGPSQSLKHSILDAKMRLWNIMKSIISLKMSKVSQGCLVLELRFVTVGSLTLNLRGFETEPYRWIAVGAVL